jgi:hypothetical protein
MTNFVRRRGIRVGEVPSSNLGAPIFRRSANSHEQDAKGREAAGSCCGLLDLAYWSCGEPHRSCSQASTSEMR